MYNRATPSRNPEDGAVAMPFCLEFVCLRIIKFRVEDIVNANEQAGKRSEENTQGEMLDGVLFAVKPPSCTSRHQMDHGLQVGVLNIQIDGHRNDPDKSNQCWSFHSKTSVLLLFSHVNVYCVIL